MTFIRPAYIVASIFTLFGGWKSGFSHSFSEWNTNGDLILSKISVVNSNYATNGTFTQLVISATNGIIDQSEMPTPAANQIIPNGDSSRLEYTIDSTLAPNRIAEINQILDEAIAMLDRPYRAGGKTPAGFDCSGFVSYCYLNGNGQKLPVSSREYYAKGTPVDVVDALPGDVILFSGRRASRTLVGHVGIITEVSDDVYFIHSATSSGIRYDRMSSPYYQNRFIGIRRF